MATRTAQIIIQVDDKSLTALNAQIKTLETSMKSLAIGTTEWIKQNEKLGTLKTQFRTATDEAKKLQNQIAKISGADQIRSIAKLGAGMVGAFAAVSGTLTTLGFSGSKTMEEITAKGVALMQVFGGLNQVAETFSATNLKGLKNIGSGFGSLVTAVKGFSTATKAALISTGIGALIVGIGLLIANFDKIKALFGAGKAGREADVAFKLTQTATKLSEQNYQTELKKLELLKQQNYSKFDAVLLSKQESDNAIAYHKSLIAQSDELAARYRLLEKKGGDTKKMTQEERDAEMQLNNAKQKSLGIEIQTAEIVKKRMIGYDLVSKKINDLNNDIQKQQDLITVANEAEYSQMEIINAQIKIYKDKRDILKIHQNTIGGITKEEEIELHILETDIQLLGQKMTMLIKEITEKQAQVKVDEELHKLEFDRLEKYKQSLDALKLESNILKNNESLSKNKLEMLSREQKLYEKYLTARAELFNFDKKGKEILNEQYQEVNKIHDKYQEIYDNARETITKKLKGITLDEKSLNNASMELALFKEQKDIERESLENKKEILDNQKSTLEVQKNEILEREKSILLEKDWIKAQIDVAQIHLDKSESLTEQTAMMEKIAEYQSQINTLSQTELNNKSELTDVNGELLKTDEEILSTQTDINNNNTDTLEKTKEITAEVQKQSRFYSKLQGVVGKYAEEIDASRKLMSQSMELMATLQENIATRMDERIAEAGKAMDEITAKEKDRNSRLLDLQEELKDANGERYDQILAQIDLEKSQQEDNRKAFNEQAQIEADAQNKKNAAEYKAAQWRKAQSIIDAVINTALAVIKALPNIFLSIATGALGAAGIATIAAQKIPEQPKVEPKTAGFKIGGYTGDGSDDEVAGVVHKKEYVVPARVTKSPGAQHHIAALESQRLRGYKDGGYVAPVSSVNMGMDYDKFINGMAQAISQLPPPQVGLVAISNGIREVELTKQNSGLSR